MKRPGWERFKRYMSVEIAIEYKACLYFFAILFFYCCYRVSGKDFTASILHMAEMILATYVMGYLQVYLFKNFDESETIGVKETACSVLCTTIYAFLSYVLCWFDKKFWVTALFWAYLLFAYFCVLLINKIRRQADTKQLNFMLAQYKEEGVEKDAGSGNKEPH